MMTNGVLGNYISCDSCKLNTSVSNVMYLQVIYAFVHHLVYHNIHCTLLFTVCVNLKRILNLFSWSPDVNQSHNFNNELGQITVSADSTSISCLLSRIVTFPRWLLIFFLMTSPSNSVTFLDWTRIIPSVILNTCDILNEKFAFLVATVTISDWSKTAIEISFL